MGDSRLICRLPWVFVGALLVTGCNSNSYRGSIAPVASQATFASIQATILVPQCVGCHSDEKASGNVNFTSYEKLMASTQNEVSLLMPGYPEKSDLYLDIENGVMPMGGSRLSDQQAQAVYNWIEAGAPAQ